MGFCLFNNVAVGRCTRSPRTASSGLAVVDFDVHHGNGTEDIFAHDPRVLMASTFQHPLYPYSGTEDPAPNMVNVPLPQAVQRRLSGGGDRALAAGAGRPSPQVIYISAGSTRIARTRSPG